MGTGIGMDIRIEDGRFVDGNGKDVMIAIPFKNERHAIKVESLLQDGGIFWQYSNKENRNVIKNWLETNGERAYRNLKRLNFVPVRHEPELRQVIDTCYDGTNKMRGRIKINIKQLKEMVDGLN